MSTNTPSHLANFAHTHPALVLIGVGAAGIYGTGYELKLLIDRQTHNPQTRIQVKEILAALSMLPAAAIIAGMLLNSHLTIRLLLLATLLLTAAVATIMWCTRGNRLHKRLFYRPLHQAISGTAGHDDSTPPQRYLTIPRDLSRVVVRLTPDAAASPGAVKQLKHTVPQVLQLGQFRVDEHFHGPNPKMIFQPIPPVSIPARLPLADILPRLAEHPGPKTIVQGVSAGGELVIADFTRVVHELISAMTGSGKSNKTTFTLMQFLHKGAVGIVVDPTGVSYPWAQHLPNVFYARDDDDVRRACQWIGAEIVRRDLFLRDHSDISGFVEGGFGPDLVVVADEKNLTERRLNAAAGNKGRDPALQTLDEVHFAGRKIGIHAVVPMVRGDARAAGGGTVRGQAGLVSFGASPKQSEWDMFFRGEPVPVSREVPAPAGRMQVCLGRDVREVQVPHCLEVPGQEASRAERAEAMNLARMVRNYAMSGAVTAVPADLLNAESESESIDTELRKPATPAPYEDGLVTLSDAAGNLVAMTAKQLKNAARDIRDNGFPEPVSRRGTANLYRRADVIAWESARGGGGGGESETVAPGGVVTVPVGELAGVAEGGGTSGVPVWERDWERDWERIWAGSGGVGVGGAGDDVSSPEPVPGGSAELITASPSQDSGNVIQFRPRKGTR